MLIEKEVTVTHFVVWTMFLCFRSEVTVGWPCCVIIRYGRRITLSAVAMENRIYPTGECHGPAVSGRLTPGCHRLLSLPYPRPKKTVPSMAACSEDLQRPVPVTHLSDK